MRLTNILLVIGCVLANRDSQTISLVNTSKYSVVQEKKFLLFEINFGEGFNLRRDVYMRIANTVRALRESGENFVLVLPPWGRLHHWTRMQVALPWRLFFDVDSLNRFVPVIEFEEFLDGPFTVSEKIRFIYLEPENNPIDQVIYLQHFSEGWGTEFVRKFEERPCMSPADSHYQQDRNKFW